jgi:hypothetical protein
MLQKEDEEAEWHTLEGNTDPFPLELPRDGIDLEPIEAKPSEDNLGKGNHGRVPAARKYKSSKLPRCHCFVNFNNIIQMLSIFYPDFIQIDSSGMRFKSRYVLLIAPGAISNLPVIPSDPGLSNQRTAFLRGPPFPEPAAQERRALPFPDGGTMPNPLKTLLFLSLVSGIGLQAGDFTKLLDTAHSSWPEKRHIGVICDYGVSLDAVEDLAIAAGPESQISVAHLHYLDNYRAAVDLLRHRKVDYLVLIPRDTLVRDGSMRASYAIVSLGQSGIPTIGTTPKAILQGAAFAIGRGTQGELLVNREQVGTVGPVTLSPVSSKSAMNLAPQPKAKITVFGPM